MLIYLSRQIYVLNILNIYFWIFSDIEININIGIFKRLLTLCDKNRVQY